LIAHKTIRVWVHTVDKLRLLYGLTGEKMVSILDRLVTQELQRIGAGSEGKNVPGLPAELTGGKTSL